MGCLGFIIFAGFSEVCQCFFPIISLMDDGSGFFFHHIIVLLYHNTGVLSIFLEFFVHSLGGFCNLFFLTDLIAGRGVASGFATTECENWVGKNW